MTIFTKDILQTMKIMEWLVNKMTLPHLHNPNYAHYAHWSEWRRNKELELSSQGRSQPQIARILQVGLGTVNRDLQHLRQEAKENIRKYVDERLPLEYQKCLVELKHLAIDENVPVTGLVTKSLREIGRAHV